MLNWGNETSMWRSSINPQGNYQTEFYSNRNVISQKHVI